MRSYSGETDATFLAGGLAVVHRMITGFSQRCLSCCEAAWRPEEIFQPRPFGQRDVSHAEACGFLQVARIRAVQADFWALDAARPAWKVRPEGDNTHPGTATPREGGALDSYVFGTGR